MDGLLSEAQRTLPAEPDPEDLTSLLFSCARLGHAPPPALLAAAADGAALSEDPPPRAKRVVRALWALGALGALTAPRLGWLLVALARCRWGPRARAGPALGDPGLRRQLRCLGNPFGSGGRV